MMAEGEYTRLARMAYEEHFVPYLPAEKLDGFLKRYQDIEDQRTMTDRPRALKKLEDELGGLCLDLSDFLISAYELSCLRASGERPCLTGFGELDRFIRTRLEEWHGTGLDREELFWQGSMTSSGSLPVIVRRFFGSRRFPVFRSAMVFVFGLKSRGELDVLYRDMLQAAVDCEDIPARYYFERYLKQPGDGEHLTEEELAVRWIRALLHLTDADPSWANSGKPKLRMNDLVKAYDYKGQELTDGELLEVYRASALGALAKPGFALAYIEQVFRDIQRYMGNGEDPEYEKLKEQIRALLAGSPTPGTVRQVMGLVDRYASRTYTLGDTEKLRDACRELLGTDIMREGPYLARCFSELEPGDGDEDRCIEEGIDYYLRVSPGMVFLEEYAPYVRVYEDLENRYLSAGDKKGAAAAAKRLKKYRTAKADHKARQKQPDKVESKKFLEENFVQLRDLIYGCRELWPDNAFAARCAELVRLSEENEKQPYLRIIALIAGGCEDFLLRGDSTARHCLREFLYDCCYAFRAPGDLSMGVVTDLFTKALELPEVNFRSAEDILYYRYLEAGLSVEQAKKDILGLRRAGEKEFGGSPKEGYTLVIGQELNALEGCARVEGLTEVLKSRLVKPDSTGSLEQSRTFNSLFNYLVNALCLDILRASDVELCQRAADNYDKLRVKEQAGCRELYAAIRRLDMGPGKLPPIDSEPQVLKRNLLERTGSKDTLMKAVLQNTGKVRELDISQAVDSMVSALCNGNVQALEAAPVMHTLSDKDKRALLVDVIMGAMEGLLRPRLPGLSYSMAFFDIISLVDCTDPVRGDLVKVYLMYRLVRSRQEGAALEQEDFLTDLDLLLAVCGLPPASPRYGADRYAVSLVRYFASK